MAPLASEEACYHPSMLASDTSAEAQAVQWKILRSMSGEQRLFLAMWRWVCSRETWPAFAESTLSGRKVKLPANC